MPCTRAYGRCGNGATRGVPGDVEAILGFIGNYKDDRFATLLIGFLRTICFL